MLITCAGCKLLVSEASVCEHCHTLYCPACLPAHQPTAREAELAANKRAAYYRAVERKKQAMSHFDQ
jgi:methionyl-tRNA synthetase